MKKRTLLSRAAGGLLAAAWATTLLWAGEPSQIDRVTIKEGKPVILENGQTRPLKKNLDLTSSIQVFTNGTFTVNKGQPRKLQEGQVLDKQGMLTSPNGTVVPVVDHLTMNRGQVHLVREGISSVLASELILPNGVRVNRDGTMTLPNGRLRRLIDGQILRLDGSVFAAQDTVTLREGKVFVQKDGTQFELRRSQSIMMNDGTKVFGDGRVVKRAGATTALTEGQILKVDGVVFK